MKQLVISLAILFLAGCTGPGAPAPVTTARVTSRPTALTRPASTSASLPASPATAPAGELAPTAPPRRPELPPVNPGLIQAGDPARPYVALTFDACQSPTAPAGYDEAVIQILTQTATPATLFLGGLWMERHPDQTRALAANSLFELGNHSWSHPDFSGLDRAGMDEEIERTQALLVELTGRPARLFRFPYDHSTAETLAIVGEHGLYAIGADVLSGDPDPQVSARAIVREVTGRAKNGSIVIMHMNGWGRHTAEALPAVIRDLREQGFRLVTVSELLDLAPGLEETVQ